MLLHEFGDRAADANIMTTIASTTAAIMIDRCSAMPTAVTTELIENTISNSAIWTMTESMVAPLPCALVLFALDHAVDFARALGEQEQAARAEDDVLPRQADTRTA